MKEAIVSSLPNCDICKLNNKNTQANYDAKTNFGQWGYLCEDHFIEYGIGLGTGKGQRLVKEELITIS